MNRFLDGSQQLVVVDNASTDSPEVAAAGWNGPHRFIGLPENTGFGAASNAGVATAATPVTVLLNPDTELLDDGLDRLAAAAARARRPGRSSGAQPRPHCAAVGEWPRGRRLALGRGPSYPRRCSPPRSAPAPSRTGSSAGSRSAG